MPKGKNKKQDKDVDKNKSVEAIENRSDEITAEKLATRPGKEVSMETSPIFDDDYPGSNRLRGKVAIITGGDSGIGRAVAVGYAKEGAKVVISYLNEVQDAKDTVSYIQELGGEALAVAGDVGDPTFCKKLIEKTLKAYGKLDILVNNAGEQHPQDSILDITKEQLERTFKTNIFSMFYLVQAALPHLTEGTSIINSSSITGYEGHDRLIDYASTKGAITTLTRSLAKSLATKKIRVNEVAPGPIWTPLIPSTYEGENVSGFGKDTLLQRAGQPIELVEAYIFFANDRASSYITGQTIHINGGRFVTN